MTELPEAGTRWKNIRNGRIYTLEYADFDSFVLIGETNAPFIVDRATFEAVLTKVDEE